MLYKEVVFRINSKLDTFQNDVFDIISALVADAGFEAFCHKENALYGYIPDYLYNEKELADILRSLPFDGVKVSFEASYIQDSNWNETWEKEGFPPINIDEQCIIHDGRHTLPASQCISIQIDAKQAFGTGLHETTRLVIKTLLEMPIDEKHVLDCGCGTGILSIVASKRGAKKVVALDIDPWSVSNTLHNAQINGEENKIKVVHGDILSITQNPIFFDIIVANICKNTLIEILPNLRNYLSSDGTIILSGFFSSDIDALLAVATNLNLYVTDIKQENNWACVSLQKISNRPVI